MNKHSTSFIQWVEWRATSQFISFIMADTRSWSFPRQLPCSTVLGTHGITSGFAFYTRWWGSNQKGQLKSSASTEFPSMYQWPGLFYEMLMHMEFLQQHHGGSWTVSFQMKKCAICSMNTIFCINHQKGLCISALLMHRHFPLWDSL